jgi:CPA2 family monovalent cation:H+ antiporter-2
MVVIKTLSARHALESSEGRVMLAILVAQDLAVVPIMLLLPQLSAEQIDFGMLLSALVKSVVFLGGMYIAGTRLLPRLFTAIASQGSRELFFLSTLGFALGAGFVSHQLELSFALGAFVAGMLLSETDFNHQALSDVANLRDLFAMIFFVSVGMLFDPAFLIGNLWLVLALVVAVLISKAIILTGLMRVLGYAATASLAVGCGLSQVGEFAFVIVNAARQLNAIAPDSYSLMISVAVVSMVLTPALFSIGATLAQRFGDTPFELAAQVFPRSSDDHGHVIIVGAGVVGRYVSRVLSTLHQPYIVIESDYKVATQARDLAIAVLFGDGTSRDILESAGLRDARLVVVTTTNDAILPTLITEVRNIRGDIPVVVRVEEVEDVQTLAGLTVEEIVQPQLEVGLEMVRQALLALKIDESEIFSLLGQLRSDRYEPGRFISAQGGIDSSRRLQASKVLALYWLEVSEKSALPGLTVQSSRLRERFGVSIVGLLRGDQFFPTPAPDKGIAQGDFVAVLGTQAQIKAVRLFEHAEGSNSSSI